MAQLSAAEQQSGRQRRRVPLPRRPRRGNICQRMEVLICVAPIATVGRNSQRRTYISRRCRCMLVPAGGSPAHSKLAKTSLAFQV